MSEDQERDEEQSEVQQAVCEHFYVTHIRGGEPVAVRICTQVCGDVDWADLREEIRKEREAAYWTGRGDAARDLLAYAQNYPESVFPPDSDSRDAIGGTAMRHAYRNASDIARGPAEEQRAHE
jgi:hypothetical protein